jgi:hypothetical protein
MFAFHTTLVALHVLFAAAWFGLALSLPALARALGQNDAIRSAGDRVVSLMGIFVGLFYIAALVNFVVGSRMNLPYGWPFHVSLTLGLLLVAVQFLLIRKAWAAGNRSRLGMAVGIGHALWLTMFVLMYLARVGVGA